MFPGLSLSLFVEHRANDVEKVRAKPTALVVVLGLELGGQTQDTRQSGSFFARPDLHLHLVHPRLGCGLGTSVVGCEVGHGSEILMDKPVNASLNQPSPDSIPYFNPSPRFLLISSIDPSFRPIIILSCLSREATYFVRVRLQSAYARGFFEGLRQRAKPSE